MLEFLNRFGLGQRILLLLIIPLICALVFAFVVILDTQSTADKSEKLNKLANFAPNVTGLIHEMQKERGRAAGYIASKADPSQTTGLEEQKKATNLALQSFNHAIMDFNFSAYDQSFQNLVQTAQGSLSQLTTVRSEVKDLNSTVPQMASYYIATIASLLDIIENMAILSDDAETTKAITAYIGILQAKERAGQERAFGNGGYSSGKFIGPIRKRFTELIAEQTAFIDTFRTFSVSEAEQYYQDTVSGTAVDNVQKMRNFALNADGGDVSSGPYKSSDWFGEITKKLTS